VPLRCSCGAVLPEDARFCHKCGKPQYEEDIARLNAAEAPSPSPIPVAQPVASSQPPSRIGFSNRRAVRITLAVAAFSLLAIVIIANLAPPLLLPILVAAGFTSVRVYLSRTAENLTASGGAALGAMTFLWLYLFEAICAAFVVFSTQAKEIAKAMKSPELAQGITQLTDDPQKLVVLLISALVIGAVSGAVGGVLAVRWQPRNGPSH
jgi:hypothetical protein